MTSITPERSRRSFLRTGALAALGLAVDSTESGASAARRPRVGIVGGGLAGVSCAWLLDGAADTVLFEARSNVGGHAHTIPVVAGAQVVFVDVGAQFFARGPHPTYTKLLELVGLIRPARPERDASVEAEMSITLMDAGEMLPRFVSPAGSRLWPALAPWNRDGVWAFLVFALAARAFTRNGSWLVPLDAWLRRLPVQEKEREGLLLPLLAAMVGCSIDQARGLSARSALLFVGRALPDDLLDPILYSNSLVGLGGNVRYLAGITRDVTTHVGSEVTSVRPRSEGGFVVENAAGSLENVDVVVFATPPYVTRALLPSIPALEVAREILGTFEFFPAEISIHRDPVYMPSSPFYWSAYNPIVDNGFSEASVWYGALRPVVPGRPPLRLFKSWATARSEAPRDEVFRRRFLHPLVTPGFIHSQRRLSLHQGRAGVWFAGSYTREVDSQETALVSAMSVVRALDPGAPNLLALESRARSVGATS